MRPPSNLVPLIDADILVYRVGFAGSEDEPLSYKLQSCKTVLEAIYDTFPDAPERKLYLTGRGNYRDNVSTTRIYKGNRDPANKPLYYDELKQYMIDYHGAVIVEGKEADDEIGTQQWAHKDRSTCTVTIDKDILYGIPGWSFNWVKNEFHYQTLAEANRFFWTQVLAGDTTDNIQGIPKVGIKKAEKILAVTDGTWVDMQDRVMRAYEAYYGADAPEVFREMATLVWIQREDNINYDGKPIVIKETSEEETSEEEGDS